ncbi:MAG: ABC transporter ATP-binding protein [Pseudomonadota bacterium]
MTGLDRFLALIDAFQPADGPPPQRLWSFFRWSLAGSEKAVSVGVVTNALLGFSELAAAAFTGWAIDTALEIGEGDPGALWPLFVVAFLFFMLARPVIFAASSAVANILLGPNLFPLVLSRINRFTLGQSLRFFENDFAGRLSQKAIQTARALSDIVVEVTDIVVYIIAMFIGALFLLALIDARLLLVFVVWFVAWIFFMRSVVPRIQARSAARAHARTNVAGQIVDTYTNITTVKLFAHDEYEDQAALQSMGTYRQRAIEFGITSAQFRFFLMTIGNLLPFLSISSALYLWSQGLVSPGDIALTAMVSTRISQVTNRLSMAAVQIFANIGEVEDGVKTLAPPHDIADRPRARDHLTAKGAVRFEGLDFAYGGEVAALTDFTLDIPPGQKVALVGASGAGKSTVTSLLLRLYDVEKGRILLDGIDIRELTQTALRRQIAVVRQETAMFNRSAFENIRYGRPEASEDEVHAAARRASAHDFISGLRDFRGREGYQAYLGERGVKLSGGQRQRIALARAILKDAPVLVLDEATSALDSEVEAEIQNALRVVMAGKTVIAIAHRLSTIAEMDRIVVMKDGRIVEDGPHDALLAQNGVYARLWSRQSGGFLTVKAAV